MNRNEIISDLYESKEIAQVLNKIKPADIREELKQEMFMALCSISDEKFWSLYNSKGVNGVPFYGIYNKNGNAGLKFWLVRTMLNMVYSNSINQPFFRHFRQRNEEFNPNHHDANYDPFEDTELNIKERLYKQVEEGRKSLSWYENNLLDTYVELGFNQMEVTRKTKIPYQSVIKTIVIIKKKLRNQC
jgi:hypothetical protein